MSNKIENTSSNKEDYIRRDFASNSKTDKYGNKSVKDEAGNVKLDHNKDSIEKDFSYQKKYNLMSRTDSEGGNYVDASVLDDAFIETLIEKTKGLISSGKRTEVKQLPKNEDGLHEYEIEEKDLDIESIASLQKIVDNYINNKSDEKNTMVVTSSVKEGIEDSTQIKICLNCEKENNINANFCQFCGNAFELKCKKCNNIISEEANFCPKCGEKISK